MQEAVLSLYANIVPFCLGTRISVDSGIHGDPGANFSHIPSSNQMIFHALLSTRAWINFKDDQKNP